MFHHNDTTGTTSEKIRFSMASLGIATADAVLRLLLFLRGVRRVVVV